jgi:hypothetical protein
MKWKLWHVGCVAHKLSAKSKCVVESWQLIGYSKNPLPPVEAQGSLLYSGVPTTCPCSVPDWLTACFLSLFLYDPFPYPLSMSRSSKWSISFNFPHQNPMWISSLLRKYISHLPSFDQPNFWWGIKTKPLIIQFSPVFCYFFHLRFKNLTQHSVIIALSPCSSLDVRDQDSHPYKMADTIAVLHVHFFALDVHYSDLYQGFSLSIQANAVI